MTSLAGRIEAASHLYPVRVFYEDTDAGGIVYHSRYLNYAERARTELLRELGIDQSRMMAEQDVAFAVRDCHIEFLRPARLDDLLTVRSRVLALAGASITLEQDVLRDDALLAALRVRVAAIRSNGRPTRIPTLVHRAMVPFLAEAMQG